jgi:alkane 1-monooxygenase
MGISCGVLGINVAHELGHRTSKAEQLMAKLLLITSCYSHFFIEHNKGHHRHVSTPNDPASAKLNQNLFSFWFISMFGSLTSSLKLDKNQIIKWKLIEVMLVLITGLIFGIKPALSFLGAALIGALLLESVNYIEHYGLRRKVLKSGRFEKVTPQHSWNSDHPIGRLILFNLSRHSDHHANINRKYQVLRSFQKDSPQYPTGYPGMILLSLIPPLWYQVMNKEVKRWEESKEI